MKKIVLIELPFLPSIGFFQLIMKYDEVCLEKFENFQKQTHRNRTSLLSNQGVIFIHIPIVRESKKKIITEVKLPLDDNWKKIHLKTIATCYRSAPYYDYYIDELILIYDEKINSLWDFNLKIFDFLVHKFALDIKLSFSTFFEKKNIIYDMKDDYRGVLTFSKQDFSENIFNSKPYQQVFTDSFVPNLSALDLLFNLGSESRIYI